MIYKVASLVKECVRQHKKIHNHNLKIGLRPERQDLKKRATVLQALSVFWDCAFTF